MKTITRASLKRFNVDAEKALAAVAKKHGVQVTIGSGSFTPGYATMKIDISTFGKDGTANTKEAYDFGRYANLVGLKPSDFGRSFKHMGKTYEIVGLKPRSRTAPIVVKRADGKLYKMPVAFIDFNHEG